MPVDYYGFDAGWEGGLASGREKYAQLGYHFIHATEPEHVSVPKDFVSTLSLCLETFEHIPENLVLGYIEKIKNVSGGYFLVTVPNEKGFVFLLKHIAKKLFYGGSETYKLKEFIGAVFGKMSWVKRNQHKGFDWEVLLNDLSSHFDVVSVSGVQFPFLPPWLNLQIGFVLRSDKADTSKIPLPLEDG